jgi:hypothetical protein
VGDDFPIDDDDDDAAVAEQEEAGVDSEVVDMSRWKMHHTGPIYAVVASVNDENLLVVSGGGDDVARHRVLAPRTGVCETTLTLTAGLTCLSDQDERLLLGAENGWAHAVHSGTRKLLVFHSLPHAAGVEGDPASVEAVEFCPTTIQPHWCATCSKFGTGPWR